MDVDDEFIALSELPDCPNCGATDVPMDHEKECPHADWMAMKYVMHELATMDEVIARAQMLVRYLTERRDTGWVLARPVDESGFLCMVLPSRLVTLISPPEKEV